MSTFGWNFSADHFLFCMRQRTENLSVFGMFCFLIAQDKQPGKLGLQLTLSAVRLRSFQY